MSKIIVAISLLCLVLTGCYKSGPDEDETRTVPITNNPHAMPGTMKTSPFPSIF